MGEEREVPGRWVIVYRSGRGPIRVGTVGTRAAAEAWRSRLARRWPGDWRVIGPDSREPLATANFSDAPVRTISPAAGL
jgi:hypothetical protein